MDAWDGADEGVRQRLPLWEAFSALFLDREPDEATFRDVARAVRASGVAIEQAEAILWNEVFPVLRWNLRSVAGEWAGWPRDWLAANLRPCSGPARRPGGGAAAREIGRCWDRVRVHLHALERRGATMQGLD